MSVAVPTHARCLECGYALRGLEASRCPECGRAFDPADPHTMDLPPPPPQPVRVAIREEWERLVGIWVSRLSRPCDVGTRALPWIAFLLTVVGASTPRWADWTLVGPWIWVCLIVGHGAVWAARAAFVAAGHMTRAAARADRRFERRAVALLAVTVALVTFDIPLHAVFAVSRPALDDVAAEVMAGPWDAPLPNRAFVGLYLVRDMEKCPHAVAVFVWNGGFVYKDDAHPCGRFTPGRHVAGKWYTLETEPKTKN